MQMSNPQFVVLLTVLILLVALNLFGLFEVTLGSVGAAAGSVASREGAGGAFFNGVLATYWRRHARHRSSRRRLALPSRKPPP